MTTPLCACREMPEGMSLQNPKGSQLSTSGTVPSLVWSPLPLYTQPLSLQTKVFVFICSSLSSAWTTSGFSQLCSTSRWECGLLCSVLDQLHITDPRVAFSHLKKIGVLFHTAAWHTCSGLKTNSGPAEHLTGNCKCEIELWSLQMYK